MRIQTYQLAAVAVASLLLCGTAAAQQVGTTSSTPVTDADCTTAWATAAASSTCTTTTLNASALPGSNFKNICVVKGNCETGVGSNTNFTDFHGKPSEVENLLNCSGDLYESNCPATST